MFHSITHVYYLLSNDFNVYNAKHNHNEFSTSVKLWFPRKAVPLYHGRNVTVDDVTKTASDQILF